MGIPEPVWVKCEILDFRSRHIQIGVCLCFRPVLAGSKLQLHKVICLVNKDTEEETIDTEGLRREVSLVDIHERDMRHIIIYGGLRLTCSASKPQLHKVAPRTNIQKCQRLGDTKGSPKEVHLKMAGCRALFLPETPLHPHSSKSPQCLSYCTPF
ncbi:hypothetical protein C5167_027864 [Papaver somniferum]|nr:hypothetical protein C5167_027864 [Papaver somniferum]